MYKHKFLFQPSYWIGEGRITFSASPDQLHFYTKWMIEKVEDNPLKLSQEVQLQGIEETVKNNFFVTDITEKTFKVHLENDMVGQVIGKGLIEDDKIAWEFKNQDGFEGFEVYELEENGDYMMHAEYLSGDQFRTIIDGRIWEKESEPDISDLGS